MMKKICYVVFGMAMSANLFAQNLSIIAAEVETGVGLLKKMHQQYYKAGCKAYTFSQKNTHYRNDSVVGHSEWHEAIDYPDQFRINFGDPTAGNYVVFKNDSSFNYKANKQVKKKSDSNTLLLLIGGMYFRSFEDALQRIKNAGYNTDLLTENQWNGRPVFVLGAKPDDKMSNQLWIDQKSLLIVRIIEKLNVNDVMDMRFDKHQEMCKGFVETKVAFYRNGHLEQEEAYYNIQAVDAFPEK